MRILFGNLLAMAAIAVASSSTAEDAFYSVRLNELTITEGELPPMDTGAGVRRWERSQVMRPYVVLDIPGEAFVNYDPWTFYESPLCVRAEAGREVTGRLFLPKPDLSGMVRLKFSIPARRTDWRARDMFEGAKLAHYRRLLGDGVPGAAWFRHQLRKLELATGEAGTEAARVAPRGSRDDIFDTFALFSGGRAISENLQLDRELMPMRGSADAAPVDVESLTGITVAEVDWTKLIKDASPELDPLARFIPADQHVVFFRDFSALVHVADEARLHGTPVVRLAEPRSEDAGTLARYERQLGLSLNDAARLLGPQLVRSVALTGSDANFRTGTDVAVLFETPQPEGLQSILVAQAALLNANLRDSRRAPGEIQGLKYVGLQTPDRKLSSYIAALDGAVVVTNSTYQLERLAAVRGGATPAVASLPEFKFFRSRYSRGDGEEAALVFLSDATIRRWCGPRWRIANSRRLRDLAVMTELEATHLDKIVNQKVQPGPIHTDLPLAGAGELTLTAGGVQSSTLGSLEFLTPIAEMPLKQVTRAETDAYETWRRGYQNNWSVAFDPIALRLTVEANKLTADLTVMPLIARSDYREMIAVSQGAAIKPTSGDPHDTLLHFVMSINPQSPTVHQASNFASAMAPGVGVEPLGWLGQSIAVYADDDPVWEELAKIGPEEWDRAFPTHAARLPVAAWFEVASPLKATVFLTGLRAFVEQTAPGMTKWESLTHREQPYVKITATEQARGEAGDLQNLAIYYAVSGQALVVSLNEAVIHRALERQLLRRVDALAQGAQAQPAPAPWLGANLALRGKQKMVEVLAAMTRRSYQESMQALAWRSLPILNEWKRLYPNRDPVEIHEQAWKVRLVCPGGGKYVWNDAWQTMESTVYGHPGEPKSGPAAPPALAGLRGGDFGLTFEDQGLRARVVIERGPRAETP